MRLATCLAAVLVLAAAAVHAKPEVRRIDPPKNILFVGNSFNYYNNSLHGHLREMARAADPDAAKSQVFKSMTLSGGYLEEHASGLPGVLKMRKWDVVILQGHSTEPMAASGKRAEKFREMARDYHRQIRETGARTAFFMTWAYQHKPEMTGPLAAAYEEIGNEVGGFVVPVGLAFERSIKARPELVLHFKDKMHPSLAGTYLAACTFYAALFGKSPVGNPYTADLDPEVAKYLQGVAWDTVKAYHEG